jgi:lysophospholipase L1-like esterase
MMRAAVLLSCLLLAAPASALRPRNVACLGDSNTAKGWPTAETVRWCEYVAELCPTVRLRGKRPRPAAFYNFGIGGAVVAPGAYVDFELAAARSVKADVVLLAFGTNDVGLLDSTPERYAMDVRAACRRSHRRCWVLSMPPHPWLPNVDEYNAAVAARMLGRSIVDRTTGVTFVDDEVHLDDDSQRLVAYRVAVALGCF